uniref:Uncharacterized protein n=1 Tax=viral metagenome TaxID=1070528 RepID=A0A6C0KEZ1_9ZZZZ
MCVCGMSSRVVTFGKSEYKKTRLYFISKFIFYIILKF